MKLSTLIAHYNNTEYFLDCYKSINNQTYKNFEIIIEVDFSEEKSFQKIKKINQNDSKVKIYRNSENKSVSYTNRKCIELALGNIFGFIDSKRTKT